MADCLLAKASFLRYGTALATDVAEGACRWLVKGRMGITGARWGQKAPQLSSSSEPFAPAATFDACWGFHLRQGHPRVHQVRCRGHLAFAA